VERDGRYDGTNLSVSAFDRSPLDISAALGTNTSFVGFTAAAVAAK